MLQHCLLEAHTHKKKSKKKLRRKIKGY